MRFSGSVLLVCAGFFALPACAGGAAALDDAVRNCRAINDRDARLNCYDGAVDAVGPITSVAPPPAPTAIPASTPSTTPSEAPPPSAPVQAAANAVPPPNSPPPTKKERGGILAYLTRGTHPKDFEIAGANTSHGQLVVTLKTGATWKQTDGKEFSRLPQAGETLTIEDAVDEKHVCRFGSEPRFYCRESVNYRK
jgi:hypothetical protein